MTDRPAVLPCVLMGAMIALLLAFVATPLMLGHSPSTAVRRAFAASAENGAPSGIVETAADPPPRFEPTAPAPTVTATATAVTAPAPTAPVIDAVPAVEVPVDRPPAPDEPLLDHNQMVIFYGSPLGLGVLGQMTPHEAAAAVRERASAFDQVNGDRGAIAALDVIYAVVQDQPTENGLYLKYMDDRELDRYLRVAESQDMQLILDLQIGRGNIPAEVRKIERYLLNPRVHVAIDPEYAVGPWGEPIYTPGTITGGEINEVQDYLADLVKRHGLPPKIVFVHQYMHDTVVDGSQVREVEGVDLVINYDGFGAAEDKREKYAEFAALPHAMKDGYNIFFALDDRVLSEHEVLELSPEPDVVFYQ